MRFPAPPFVVVIFNAERSPNDQAGYAAMSAAMEELVVHQPGYIAHDFFRAEDGSTTTLSYWETPEDVTAFRRNVEHQRAQDAGRNNWYRWYERLTAEVKSVSVYGHRPDAKPDDTPT